MIQTVTEWITYLMVQVCHVLVYIQEGSRINTQALKKLRILQAAKQALSTFMRSQSASHGVGAPNVASFRDPPVSISMSKNTSPGNNGGGMRRNASSFSGVSGLGSSTSMFPGSCTPVTIFVCLDDFSSRLSSSSTSEVTTDKSYIQPGNMSGLNTQGLPVKGACSVVVLARPAPSLSPALATKSEQIPHKKLQSSLESQIRFLVKKSKLQIGSERSRSGLRNGGACPSSTPLLSLDASKAVILVDRLSNQKGKSLDFACGIVGEILRGKATSDTLLLENHTQMVDKDDLKSLKDFIMHQSDIFRGRGGPLSTGVGMIAAAVAAATASSSSGKSVTVPELPNLKVWLSITHLILHGLVSNRLECQKPIFSEVNNQRNAEEADRVVYMLESGTGLNAKFSNLWCQRVLPAAKDIYLQDLPSCYSTGRHETHLQKALTVFHSMVKGPAVQRFSKQLEEDCTVIWKSGRQLCDAVSLTGQPCVHQRHDMISDMSESNAIVSSHSSSFVFLHACACGRSRFLRPDPFDFETASSSSLCTSECGKLPHGCQFPQISYGGNGQLAAWSLIRIGAASYYDPTKGLLQSGFCDSQKFLLSWIIFLQKPNFSKVAPVVAGSTVGLKVLNNSDVEPKKDVGKFYQRDEPQGVVNKRILSVSDKVNGNTSNSVREFPKSTIRKPFSEIVAGSAVSDVDFPPLKQSTLVLPGTDKGLKHDNFANGRTVKVYAGAASHDPRMNLDSVDQKGNVSSLMNDKDNWPQLQTGNSSMSGNLNGSENSWVKQVVVYVGFEYECPYGHRFILSSEHLLEPDLSNTASEESLLSDSTRKSNHRFSDTENGLKSSPRKTHQRIYENNVTMHRGRGNGKSKEKIPFKLRERISTGERQLDASSGHGNHYLHRGLSPQFKSATNIVESSECVSPDSIGSASSLLNTNLPVYINCPHCQNSKNKGDAQNVKFASTISQLQRIFMVSILLCRPFLFSCECCYDDLYYRFGEIKTIFYD